MSRKKYFFLTFLIIVCNVIYSQTGLKVYNLYYSDFINGNFKNDTTLLQSDIKKNIGDGEYFIYHDTALTSLWLNGAIFNNKLEGKWEFRNKENEIIYFKMFSNGVEIKVDLTENEFAKIYLPNKMFEYNAYYIAATNDTLTCNLVTLNITSQLYEIRHNARFEGNWIFHYSKDDSLLLGGKYPWNDWEENTICLITENEDKIEIYPPRRNQFVFTETIKFPSISPVNLKLGYKWQSQTQIPEDYKLIEWENNTFYHKSEITGRRTFNFKGNDIECWIIKGNSFNPNFGQSYFEYLFNEEYGFVRMEWISYEKQKVIFELINLKITN